jgi:hypothetical protein
MEHALKTVELSKAVVLANCFVNKNTIGSGYEPELEREIEEHCPDMFKNGLRIPEFYMNIIKSKVSKA